MAAFLRLMKQEIINTMKRRIFETCTFEMLVCNSTHKLDTTAA